MTNEHSHRIIEAIAETNKVLARATSYLPQHQDRKLIADYEVHLTKLNKMLS